MVSRGNYNDEVVGALAGLSGQQTETDEDQERINTPSSISHTVLSGIRIGEETSITGRQGSYQVIPDLVLPVGEMREDSHIGAWRASSPTTLEDPTLERSGERSDLGVLSFSSMRVFSTSYIAMIPSEAFWTVVDHDSDNVWLNTPYILEYRLAEGTEIEIEVPVGGLGNIPYTYSVSGINLNIVERDSKIFLTGTDSLTSGIYSGIFQVEDAGGLTFSSPINLEVVSSTGLTDSVFIELDSSFLIPSENYDRTFSAEVVYRVDEEDVLSQLRFQAFRDNLSNALAMISEDVPSIGVWNRAVLSNISLSANSTMGFQIRLTGPKVPRVIYIDRIYVEEFSDISEPINRARVGGSLAT